MATANSKRTTAVKALADEAEDTMVSVEYDGEEYTFDTDGVTDIEFLEAYEDGRGIGACRELLGPEQWAKFKASKLPKKVKDTDLRALMDLMFEAVGSDSGE